jgi:hypothetical protein
LSAYDRSGEALTRYVFSDFSIAWLKENRFRDDEVKELEMLLNMREAHRKKDGEFKLPAVGPKVAAIFALLDSITDAEGRPICFEENGLIDVPDEARNYFDEDMELEELDRAVAGLKKVKFARRYSYPRRRGENKQGRAPPEL